ncbi:lipoic acid synthetase [Keratinibaculum paraultunense]|uniref:Lipoyl synthase n=1 Tax=Keratinibaculum paraultunense TaxID=1278232 RepID=A0A4R3KZ17_9FIRM|nr:lipoyl synthase [Keratinibaculum paraultunense]QQY80232.1 lipoyl synthase [Keratinibaculum paraultunense]TCS90744.1 lipoic acid synthetase [Keratinibaculum paraultunense]
MYIKKPEWLRIKMQGGNVSTKVQNLISDLSLNTVCDEANCPNRMECFQRGTATFMILGRNCTRNCTFCNVTKAKPDEVDPMEPEKIAKAVSKLGLKHAVITSVTRDDLEDQGANQFAKVVEEIRKTTPEVTIELLIPDMQGNKKLIDIILNSEPNILNHNVETVPELYDKVRPMAVFERSIELLNYVKKTKPNIKTKSGMMLGLGETKEQVINVFKKLREVNCDILTLGQYLQPSKAHIPVVEYITPEQFNEYKKIALSMGFKKVASAPLVRSSYYAEDFC